MRVNNKVVFDARELLDKRRHKGKALLKMVQGPGSYDDQGVKFWQEHPFQLVPKEKVDHFLGLSEYGFVSFEHAQVKDVENYYVE